MNVHIVSAQAMGVALRHCLQTDYEVYTAAVVDTHTVGTVHQQTIVNSSKYNHQQVGQLKTWGK